MALTFKNCIFCLITFSRMIIKHSNMTSKKEKIQEGDKSVKYLVEAVFYICL